MKKNSKKSLIILTLISIVICGCPGCLLVTPGMINMIDILIYKESIENLLANFGEGFIQGGWMVCPGVVLILIPVLIGIYTLVKKNKPEELTALTPTGASIEDPLPPPS